MAAKSRMPNNKRKIKVCNNGPYFVSGGIPLVEQIIHVNAEGDPDVWCAGDKYPTRENYLLCRCGMSKNKPFCDSSHYPK